MTDTIIEAAARARSKHVAGTDVYWEGYTDDLVPILTAVTPLIRAQVLEEAVQVAEEQVYYPDTNIGMRQQWVKDQIAAKIRALKEQP